MNGQDIMELMKAHQEAYLAAYNAGYTKGFSDAADKAVEMFKASTRKYQKKGNGEAPAFSNTSGTNE